MVLIYVNHDNKVLGPYPKETITTMLMNGSILPTDMTWHPGLSERLTVVDLFKTFEQEAEIQNVLPPSTPIPANSNSVSSSTATATQLPEPITAELRKFQEHIQITCMKCGYQGLAGVVSHKKPPYISTFWKAWLICWLIIIASLFLSIATNFESTILAVPLFISKIFLSPILILSGIIMGIVSLNVSTLLILCPNCKENLTLNL